MNRMNHWWADTLFKRLFVLMWVALVVSHLCAFLAVRAFTAPPGVQQRDMPLPPVMPSLPPGGLLPGEGPRPAPRLRRLAATRRAIAAASASCPAGPARRGRPARRSAVAGLRRAPAGHRPGRLAGRALVVGADAPAGRRVAGAGPVAGAVAGQPADAPNAVPRLDEDRGTLEVRQTAQVFNTMAQRLVEEFKAQGLLMAAISHDLRTPLARMRLRLEQMNGEPQAAACIADLREMDSLVGSVLDLVRDQHSPAALQRVDVLRAGAGAGRRPGRAGPDRQRGRSRRWRWPSAALKRVMSNLVGNALRHGGSAEVSVRRTPIVFVDDRGPGIPPGQLDAVFKPFYRLASSDAAGSTGSAWACTLRATCCSARAGSCCWPTARAAACARYCGCPCRKRVGADTKRRHEATLTVGISV